MRVAGGLRAVAAGLAAGSRTTYGLVAAAFSTGVAPSRAGAVGGAPRAAGGTGGPVERGLRLLRGPVGRGATALLTAAELVGDKLPQTPSRLEPPGLVSRIVTGAVGGAAVQRVPAPVAGASSGGVPGADRLAGAGLGIAAAVLSAHACARIRAYAADRGWPDPPVAVAEDLAGLALALWAAVGTKRRSAA